MKPQFKKIDNKKMVGISLRMSLVNNRTPELWSGFMPRRNEVKNRIGPDFFSLQVYDSNHFDNFNPNGEFDKWALVEADNYDGIPTGMQAFDLQSGQYAVFIHKGANTNMDTFQYIFTNWLPSSQYQLDDRPHFEILGAKYKNNDPESEEEIRIPVKAKG